MEEQKEKFKNLNENLKNFSIEEYSKFFLVLSNTQKLLTVDSSSLNKNKDFIRVDNKLLNYDENNKFFYTGENFKDSNEKFKEINKFIKRKDLSLNSIIKEKLGNNNNINEKEKFSENEIKSNTNLKKENTFRDRKIDNSEILENLVKNLQNEFDVSLTNDFKNKLKTEFKGIKGDNYKIYIDNEINEKLDSFLTKNKNLELNEINNYPEEEKNFNYIKKLKGIIKLNISYANSNYYYKLEKEDTILLDFIFEFVLNKDLFNMLKFWLYQEYLSINDSESLSSLRRYDNILNEISNRIEKNEVLNVDSIFQDELFKFIIDLPNLNEKSIDLFLKNYKKSLNLLELNFYNIDNLTNLQKELEKKEDLFLNNVYNLYKKLKKKLDQFQNEEFDNNPNDSNYNKYLNKIALKSNYLDLVNKLRTFILNFNNIENKNIIQKRIRFISEKIILLKIDDEEIHKYSIKQFESLMKYHDDPINETIVFGKYSLFFFLSLNYRDEYLNNFIKECPKIYSNCSRGIKNEIDKKIEKNFINKILSYENIRDLIRNCDENSYEIVLMVIRSIKSDNQIERFSSEILNYYLKNGELKEIMTGMTNNIFTFFFICNEKLKIIENNLNNFEYLENIFNEINTNASNDPINNYIKKDSNIQNFTELMEKIKDKVIFYILFFIQEFIIRKNIPLNKLNSFMKLFEKISNNGVNEKLNENFIYLIDLIKLKKTSEYNFFQIINYFLDYFKSKNIKNLISSKINFNFLCRSIK